MANPYSRLVQQRLLHAKVQLDQAGASSGIQSRLSNVTGALFHLICGYRLYLAELAWPLAGEPDQPLENVYQLEQLMSRRSIGITNSSEIQETARFEEEYLIDLIEHFNRQLSPNLKHDMSQPAAINLLASDRKQPGAELKLEVIADVNSKLSEMIDRHRTQQAEW